MNLHPLLVHFPIALWIIYCSILVLQLFWWAKNEQLNTIKRFCLIIWTIGWMMSLATWDSAKHIFWRSNLVETHEGWAQATANLFNILSVLTIYFMQTWTNKYERDANLRKLIWGLINNKVMWIIGIIWICMLTVVGALGGAISRSDAQRDIISTWIVWVLVK